MNQKWPNFLGFCTWTRNKNKPKIISPRYSRDSPNKIKYSSTLRSHQCFRIQNQCCWWETIHGWIMKIGQKNARRDCSFQWMLYVEKYFRIFSVNQILSMIQMKSLNIHYVFVTNFLMMNDVPSNARTFNSRLRLDTWPKYRGYEESLG